MSTAVDNQWDEQAISAVSQPFEDHMLDQFYTTLASRGYQVKTAQEAQSCMQLAVTLQEKIASGEIKRPAAKPTLLDALNEKIASSVNQADPFDNIRQDIAQKTAAAVEDPFVVYAAAALAYMQNSQQ